MRSVVLALALALPGVPMVARAQPPPARAQPPPSPPGIGFAGRRPAPGTDKPRWGDGKTGRGPQPIDEPAKGPPYNLTHIAYASVIMLAMLAFTIWLIRRHRRQ